MTRLTAIRLLGSALWLGLMVTALHLAYAALEHAHATDGQMWGALVALGIILALVWVAITWAVGPDEHAS